MMNFMKSARFNWILGVAFLALAAIGGMNAIAPREVVASDHDDGETSTKGRNVNLTDLYVFREQDQNPSAKPGDLVFIMNTNPRSVARQQYYFSPQARYEFHVSRVANRDETPSGREDLVLRFEFNKPEGNAQQAFRVTALSNGRKIDSASGKTMPLAPNPATEPIVNNVSLAGSKLAVFAGLREDPFFFDVEQFFRVRAGAAKIGPAVGFRDANQAVDFAKGYNVNAIAVRIPRAFLQAGRNTDIFDVWQTISVRNPETGRYTQVERLGRPAVNEGLVLTNDFLNAFNSIPPSQDLSGAAAPVRSEARNSLLALGNNPQTADALLAAFLPDVMRIDTTQRSGYVNAVNAKGSPIAGRMLMDDVVDQTLSVLTGGRIKSDNVSYYGSGQNPAQGHRPLVSQFPYLALPN
jgi:Domain of unknown function (DUF4331)